MRKILSIAIALLATSMAWAQDQLPSSNGEEEFIADYNIVDSKSDIRQWMTKTTTYTYADGTKTHLITLNQNENSHHGWDEEKKQDYSANQASERVHFEIYPLANYTLSLRLTSDNGLTPIVINVTAGQWNVFDMKVSDFGTLADWTKVGNVIFAYSGEETAYFVLDNYYFHHGIYKQGPTTPPGAPQYKADKYVMCSYIGECINLQKQGTGTAGPYDYHGTTFNMPYMHIKLAKNAYIREQTESFDFSANGTNQRVHIEVWSATAISLDLKLSNNCNKSTTVSLNAGEWTPIDLPISVFEPSTYSAVGTVRFKAPADAVADIYVDNYYFHHEEPFVEPVLEIGSVDTEGVRSVTGTFNWRSVTTFLDEIKKDDYKNTVFYNLTQVANYNSLPFNARMTASNPNAVFAIAWNDSYLGKFDNKTNVGYTSGKKFYPQGNVEYVDGYDILHPSYNIGTLPTGCTISYDRPSITGVATTVLPFDADVPTGVTAYEYNTFDTSQNKLVFTPVTTMEAFKPYIIEGGSLQVSSTETKNGIVLQPASVDISGLATFTGTFQAISAATTTAAGNMYVLSDNVFKKSNGKIGAFRSYMTFTAAPSRNFSVVFGDETTGMRPATPEEMEAMFNVYSIDGRIVKSKTDSIIGLPAGVYVINGKKVVIK